MNNLTNAFITELKKQHAEYVENNPSIHFVRKVKAQNALFMEDQVRLGEIRLQENTVDDKDFNLYDIYYSDASKYTKQYYGDVYHATTRHDNDWD